jgi:hypothetical protein
MSVDTERIIGFTVKIKENLTHEDFEFFENVEEKHKEFAYRGKYSQFGMKPSQVALVVDGMNGDYARLVYVENVKSIYGAYDEDPYTLLRPTEIPEEIYNELNIAYQKIYEMPLDKKLIEYALWYHWS